MDLVSLRQLPSSSFIANERDFHAACHNIGATAGVAIVVAILNHSLTAQLNLRLPQTPDRDEIIRRSAESLEYVASLVGEQKTIVIAAYIRSLTWMHAVSVVFGVGALVAAMFIREHKL